MQNYLSSYNNWMTNITCISFNPLLNRKERKEFLSVLCLKLSDLCGSRKHMRILILYKRISVTFIYEKF